MHTCDYDANGLSMALDNGRQHKKIKKINKLITFLFFEILFVAGNLFLTSAIAKIMVSEGISFAPCIFNENFKI